MSPVKPSCTFIMFVLCVYSTATKGEFEKRHTLKTLEDFVLSKSNSTIPPFRGNETFVIVHLEYSPLIILELDSANEELRISSLLIMSWEDLALTWRPEDHGDEKFLMVDPVKIWTPQVGILNSITDLQTLQTRNPMKVGYTGRTQYILKDVLTTRCKMDVSRYPFDYQRCQVIFVPAYGYNISIGIEEANLGDINIAAENGEWIHENTEHSIRAVGNVGLQAAVITLTLRRKILYYCLNILFPMVLLSVLTPFVFLIPARSGEKLTFLMSIFVSHAMFLNLIHQSMPPTSDAVSTLAVFLVIIELQGFLTILATIVVLCVHDRHQKRGEKRQSEEKSKKEKEVCGDFTEVKTGLCHAIFKDTQPDRIWDLVFFVLSMMLSAGGLAFVTKAFYEI